MVTRVQNNGLARITSLLAAAAWYIGWGTGSAAAATANALTTTSTTEARVAATTSQQTATVANDKLRLTATLTAAGSRAITEVGAFDGAGTGSPPTGANLDFYADFSVVNLNSGDAIAFTLEVTVSS